MSDTFLIDTSIYLNILAIPGKCQERKEVLADLELYMTQGASFLLPIATIWETGRHIAHLKDGSSRYRLARQFVGDVQQALAGKAPYDTTYMPGPEEFRTWLPDFPDMAKAGLSLADHSIVRECLRLRAKTANKHPPVWIWSLDEHLAAYGKGASRKHP